MVTSPRRHRDDRIISRTLAYAIVTGLLVGVYAGIVLLATRVVSITAPVAVGAAGPGARPHLGVAERTLVKTGHDPGQRRSNMRLDAG